MFNSLTTFKYKIKLFQELLCNVVSHVVLFAYPIKLNIWAKNTVTKFYQRSCIVNLSDLCNVIEKILETILCHKHFKSVMIHGETHFLEHLLVFNHA